MKLRILFLLMALSLVAIQPVLAQSAQRGLAITPTPSDPVAWGTYHALIIGINDYKEWPRLQTAVKDATTIRNTLVKRYGFAEKNVILRTDGQASRLQILKDLRSMATSMGKADNLLVYYAGHGQLDDLTGDGYWVPAEGKLKDPGTWVANSYIKAVLSSERVQAKNVVVIADSCYSGSMLRGGPSLMSLDDGRYREKLVKKAALRSRQVISSGGVEPVADGGADGHSLFAFYLIDALRKNQREVIDLENLFHTRVWKPVTQIGDQRPNVGRLKTPMDQDGQFVLYNASWAQARAEKRAAEDVRKQKQALATQVANAELELQRQRIEMERQKLALEQEQLARQKALELERLKVERQKQEIEYARMQAQLEQMKAKRTAAPEQNLQAALDPSRLNSRQAARGEFNLAIFPFKILAREWGAQYIGPSTAESLQAISDVALEDGRIALKYAYREFEGAPEDVKLLRDVLPSSKIDVWKKKTFLSKLKPDWQAIRKLGLQIDANPVIVLDADVGSNQWTYYLLDTKNDKLYSTSNRAHYSKVGPFVEEAVNDLLKQFYRAQ